MIPLTYFLIRVRYQDLPATPAPARRPRASLARRVSRRLVRLAPPAGAAASLGSA
jgi:hypothetical protein